MLKRYFSKGISALLSLSLILTSVSPDASAVRRNPYNYNSDSERAEKRVKDKRILGVTVAVGAGIVATAVVAGVIYNKVQRNQINEEVRKYKNRAPDIFEIEDDVLEKADPKVLLITLRQLNKLFDKYGKFTQWLIKDFSENREKFTIKFIKGYSGSTIASTNLYGINLSRKYYTDRYRMYDLKRDVKSGFKSPTDDDKMIHRVITHEFGHLLERIYVSNRMKCIQQLDMRSFLAEVDRLGGVGHAHDTMYSNIRSQIISYANGNILYDIGEYAMESPGEFFAEAFATMECSTDPRYEYIRQAVRRTISTWLL